MLDLQLPTYMIQLENPSKSISRLLLDNQGSQNGCIFDLDGTLVDSDLALLEAWKYGLNVLGKGIEDRNITRYFGMSSADIARLLLKDDSNNVDTLVRLKEDFLDTNWKELIKPIPGVVEVLVYLNQCRVKCAVASSNLKRRIEVILKGFDLARYFNVIVGRDEVEKGKPYPDLVVEAARRLDLPTSDCFYIGDSIYDIKAGKNAGSKTVLLVYRPINVKSLEVEPDHVIYAFEDLKEII